MTRRQARRIRNISRFWVEGIRRKVPRRRVRFCVYCPTTRSEKEEKA